MCGRYASFTPADRLHRLFRTVNPTPNLAPTWNMAPTRDAPVVRLHPKTHQRHLDLLHWGLVPHWAREPKATRQPINARAETLATSPMFRDALARRRCLVPADAFYEWQVAEAGVLPAQSRLPQSRLPGELPAEELPFSEVAPSALSPAELPPDRMPPGTPHPAKLPWAIARADGAPLVFAGLWEGWRGADGTVLRTFTIVTTQANRTLAAVHDRMPVVIEPQAFNLWLDCANVDATTAATLVAPAAEDLFECYEISPAVNRVANDSAQLIEPVPAVADPDAATEAHAPATELKPKKQNDQPSLF